MLILSHMLLNGRTGHEAGRYLLSQMYLDHIGTPMPDIILSPRGKPLFVDSPYHFSISHTPSHVFCALADHPIGIDAEECSRKVNLRLASRILSPSEQLRFARSSDPPSDFLRYWVLKEALVKFTGEGLKGYPNFTDFSADDPRIQIIDGCFVAVIAEEEPHAF